MRKYLGAVAARPRAGFGQFGCVISRGGPNLVLTRVVTAPNDPPRYVIDISSVGRVIKVKLNILRCSSRGSFYRPSKVV